MLSTLLKQAQTMCIKTPTMITQLREMKKNKEWISESNKFFNCKSRHLLTMRHLDETLTQVEGQKNSMTAKQILD